MVAKKIIRILVIVCIVLLLLSVNYVVLTHPEALSALQQIGLIGLFFLSVLSGFNVVVPIPVSLLYPSFAALGYTPIVLISIIAIGMTMGDIVGFVLGRSMSDVVLRSKQGKKITRLVQSHPRYIIIGTFFYAMLVPLPNELIVMPLAALGTSWQKVLIPILIGNAIFSTVLAFGSTQIVQLFV